MTSIQRIAASAVQLNPEVNISLFNANIDFCLRKCEAPVELVPLGERLSKQRRELAEKGSFHILARRLGILFEEILPNVPSLLKAYGARASEIAREFDNAGSPPKSIADGIFGPHLGIDSTSIWAGATSGSSSLLMHLLACMLARMWSPQEATAIWAELIEWRREVVKTQATENDRTSNFFAQQAALYDMDWSNLQGWDASARAWLQIADESSRKRQQKQIELIVNNLSVAIQTQVTSADAVRVLPAGKENTYDSVIHNFCSALSTLDNLVSGKPQRILDGGVLLGLTSWHLYPDLVILGPKTQEIHQEDPLVGESGLATLSIAYKEDPHGNQDGVYWSLPLASLRYYGTVECKRSSLHDSKLSISEFQALILGASLDSLDALPAALDVITALWAFGNTGYQDILRGIEANSQNPNELQCTAIDLEILQEQIRLSLLKQQTGEYELRNWMDSLHLLSPLIGGIELLRSDIESERKVAMQLIRYGFNSARSWIGSVDNLSVPFLGPTDAAIVLQAVHNPVDRVHILRALCQSVSFESDEFIIRFRRDDDSWEYAWLSRARDCNSRKRRRSEFESEVPDLQTPAPPEGVEWIFLASVSDHGTVNLSMGVDESVHDTFAAFIDDEHIYARAVFWNLVVGIHSQAAVYTRLSHSAEERSLGMSTVPLSIIHDFIIRGSLDLEVVMNTIQSHFTMKRRKHLFSLLALGRVIDHYKHELAHITIPMSIIKESPESWSWARSVVRELELQQLAAASLAKGGTISQSLYPSPLTRQQAFALILQFESGTLSVDVDEMDSVMAISSGNSLFVAQKILHDPILPENYSSCAVAHAIGNVGRPGIALLFAPDQPRIREHDIEKWQVVNHDPFDGNLRGGMFEGSSLQMSFTGWEGPLRVRGPSAFRGMEAYNLETQISMYDKGEWVADLDILKSLKDSPNLRVCGIHDHQCDHDPSITACGTELVSVDCWEELLSPADRPMVLRSGSSWMARLTGVSIAYSKGYKCYILPTMKAFCWTCVVEEMDLTGLGGQRVLVVY